MNVIWSEQARNSLADIYDYIYNKDSPNAAEKVLQTLLDKASSLSDERVEYPKDPHANSERFRFILQWSYKIIYERTDNKVVIIDVFHTKQDPGRMVF